MARFLSPPGRRPTRRSGRRSRRHARSWSTILSRQGGVRRAVGRRPIDAIVVEQVGRLFIPISAILDLHAQLTEHDVPQPTQDAIRAHHQALAGWFRQAALWTRSGEGAGAVVDGLPEPPALSGPGDHLAALATWYGVLHRDIRNILDEVGPQPHRATVPPVEDALHATG